MFGRQWLPATPYAVATRTCRSPHGPSEWSLAFRLLQGNHRSQIAEESLVPSSIMMSAMRLHATRTALSLDSVARPVPRDHELLIEVLACGVCRTDLHVVDGELPDTRYPIIPGHEVVGRVIECGRTVTNVKAGDRVGVPWLAHTCGICRYCRNGMENLCDFSRFTAYT